MQTFLPYPEFENSARVLDDKRLGKQRVEVLQILNALTNPNAKGWINHPCTNMWRGHERALIRYGVAICDEWVRRGHADTVKGKLLEKLEGLDHSNEPEWLGREDLHAAHRANLLRKDEEFYRAFGWFEPCDLPYVWPVQGTSRARTRTGSESSLKGDLDTDSSATELPKGE